MDRAYNLENLQISELQLLNEALESSNKKERVRQKVLPKKRAINFTIIVLLSLFTLLGINFSLDVYQSYLSIASSSQFLALSYLFIYFVALLGIALYAIHSIKSYINLKDAFTLQAKTANVESYEEEKQIALAILSHYKLHQRDEIQSKAAQLYNEVSTNSLHSPFLSIKDTIITPLDKEALATLYSSAKEVSLFTAFAPGSALDSLAVIFSSLKLMKRVFYIYGYRTNFFTSLFILRKIVENASIAALVEYADDSINDLLGNTLVSKLSTKVAQGVGNGVLMLRVGNILINSARPFKSDGSVGSYKHMVKIFLGYIKEKFGKK